MKERIGVTLAVAEELGEKILDSKAVGIFLVIFVWVTFGIVLGTQILR